MKKNTLSIWLISLLLFSGQLAAEETASSIIKKMDEVQTSKSSASKMSMIVYPDAEDEGRKRSFKMLGYALGDDKSYSEFITPKTIKGLRILSIDGDIWAYFSSTGRVRKIAGKSKEKSVGGVGGDFSYEDFGNGNFEEDYNVKIIKNESKQWVIEGKPKTDDISYTKVLLYVDKKDYLPSRLEYFKEEGLTKTLTLMDKKVISGKPTATRMEMYNHQKDSKTVILMHEMKYDLTIPEKFFNPTRFYK